jgi:spermidine synthase
MSQKNNSAQWLLLVAVFIIATCGLVYELVAGTLASYVLGDSITQFSTIIGVYLFSMGVGSYLSKYLADSPGASVPQPDDTLLSPDAAAIPDTNYLLQWFIRIELLVGLVGGFSSTILFLTFPVASSFRIILYALVFLTGMLVGLELPLLMRILKDKVEFKELVSRVFTFDYVGALLASLVFPLLLVPYLGLIRTSLFFGMLNTGVGWWLLHRFRREVAGRNGLQLMAIAFLVALLAAFFLSGKIMNISENMVFNDPVIYSTSSPYQRIVITRSKRELRLYLNGNLQFSSADEYRYHEALVHPAMLASHQPRNILVMGGGDGLALREILKYPSVQHVTLVDLDASMTKLFSTQPVLRQLNHSSFLDPRVTIYNKDAFVWLRDNHQIFDCAIIDFPDPSNFSIGKLYSLSFYQLVKRALAPRGMAVIQSTSPYVAPKSFWCVTETLKAAGFHTIPYHNYVPSFGEWGYTMATQQNDYQLPDSFPAGMRYINRSVLQQMLNFPADMQAHQPIAVNRLNNQALVDYFEQEWNGFLDQ